jgi:hypothetical protein
MKWGNRKVEDEALFLLSLCFSHCEKEKGD